MSENENRNIGPWRVESARVAFENPWVQLVDHRVIHPNGSLGEYGVIRFKNRAIGILPLDENGFTWLVGQHRFPLDKYSWELPEGGGPQNVSPLDAAQRELREETGLTAANWEELIRFDISNSVTDETAICYIAWGLDEGVAAPDASEELAVQKIHFSELLEMTLSGEISDSLTIIMVTTAYLKALRDEEAGPISRVLLEPMGQT